jgi:hypothetical protein
MPNFQPFSSSPSCIFRIGRPQILPERDNFLVQTQLVYPGGTLVGLAVIWSPPRTEARVPPSPRHLMQIQNFLPNQGHPRKTEGYAINHWILHWVLKKSRGSPGLEGKFA